MPPKRKAKQTTRATPGKAPRHTRLSAALGAPPSPSTSVDFEDAEELQEIVAEVTARSAVHDAGASSEAVVATSGGPSRVAWEQQVDAHMANTDRLLLEMHGMLQSALSNTRPDVVDLPAPSTAMPVQEQAPIPWPSTSGMGFDAIIGSLPEATQERVSGLTASSLPIHAHVPQKLKNKIWADEFIELGSLLKTAHNRRPDYSLSIQPATGEGEPMFSVASKAHTELKSFPQWNRAFEIFMSVYLSKPSKVDQAPNLLKYVQTVRNLSERGGDWQAYDEAFRSMRVINGWGWDWVHWELWMNAAQSSHSSHSLHSKAGYANSPFHGKERTRPSPQEKLCFGFNRGEPCYTDPCIYKHSCKNCGGRHPSSKCTTRSRNQRNQPAMAAAAQQQKTKAHFMHK